MAELFKRDRSDKWQAECYYWRGDKRRRVLKSTGVRDDGTAKSRQTAQIVADQIERSLALGGEAATAPRKTLQQAVAALAEACELAGNSRDTLLSIVYRGECLAADLGEKTALADIDAARIREYAQRARRTRAASSVDRELALLRQAFDAVGVEPPKFPDLGDTSSKPQRLLEVDELRRLLLAVPARHRLNVMAYSHLGLRLSEPWKIVEIDWDERYAVVQRTKRRKDRGAPSVVPIPDELLELLEQRRGQLPIFPKLSLKGIDKIIRQAARRAGICDDLSVNDLRGTYATHMARAGVPILTLAAIMGNSVKMLERVYAQVNKRGDHLADAASKVPRLTGASTVHQKPRDRRGPRHGAVGNGSRND
ncbi:MAG: tyrosine-type recombinase/integrase [Gammaproteobacteria bacterium]|nr:tyrosine-type recombinase/integrase [Gammaproteobacteria bacterium]